MSPVYRHLHIAQHVESRRDTLASPIRALPVKPNDTQDGSHWNRGERYVLLIPCGTRRQALHKPELAVPHVAIRHLNSS